MTKEFTGYMMQEGAQLLHEVDVDGHRAIHLAMEEFRGNYRLYYHRDSDGSCGKFVVLDFVSCTHPEEPWEGTTTQVAIVMRGVTYFDGVRHVWVSPEVDKGLDKGYLYYPDMRALSEIFSRLAELFPDE